MKNQPLHKEKAGFLGATKIPWPIFQLTADGILAGFSIELRISRFGTYCNMMILSTVEPDFLRLQICGTILKLNGYIVKDLEDRARVVRGAKSSNPF